MKSSLINLVNNQTYNNSFSRLDLMVRYSFLEGLDNFSIYEQRKLLYEKMQFNRCGTIKHTSGRSFVDEFISMSNSFKKNGFIQHCPLVINESGHLINSSHRASCCLYYNIENFSVRVAKDWKLELENKQPKIKSYFMYGRDWFERNGFTKSELEFINSQKLNVMKKIGNYFVFTLWDPSKKYHEDIIQDISKKTDIISLKNITVSHKDYKSIVRSLYSIDDIAPERIEAKIKNMPKASEITYVLCYICSPTFRRKNVNPNVKICTEVEKIKKEIRNKYKSLIENYYYDNIIHAGDNFNHSSHIMSVFGNR